ncbi:hypothetical protein L6452_40722 [Arctium lappa]|uniref:Uncharacterized protein n=1 Tax=Arctium lappa TaxID=4217 RepID=A0ACB8XNJ8_ARCLA|nr:hypothetical protein L6452_40722 [Arctium lappa]
MIFLLFLLTRDYNLGDMEKVALDSNTGQAVYDMFMAVNHLWLCVSTDSGVGHALILESHVRLILLSKLLILCGHCITAIGDHFFPFKAGCLFAYGVVDTHDLVVIFLAQ